jgi:hypothetical protein
MVKAVKSGSLSPSKISNSSLRGKVVRAAKGMSMRQINDYLKLKRSKKSKKSRKSKRKKK